MWQPPVCLGRNLWVPQGTEQTYPQMSSVKLTATERGNQSFASDTRKSPADFIVCTSHFEDYRKTAHSAVQTQAHWMKQDLLGKQRVLPFIAVGLIPRSSPCEDSRFFPLIFQIRITARYKFPTQNQKTWKWRGQKLAYSKTSRKQKGQGDKEMCLCTSLRDLKRWQGISSGRNQSSFVRTVCMVEHQLSPETSWLSSSLLQNLF